VTDVVICTDSSALFPDGVAERLGVTVVPIPITLDNAPFEDQDARVDEFYTRVSEGAQVTTSQPSPGALLEIYARAAANGAAKVLSIHLDARVSGTVGSAELVAREAPIPVTVVDTRTVSFGVGLCVRAAAEAIADGASAGEAAAAATRVGATLLNVFVAHRGPPGRLPEAAGWAVLEFSDGTAEPVGACDSIGEAIDAMAARVLAEDHAVSAAVGHAGSSTEAAADALALSLSALTHVVEVERYRPRRCRRCPHGPVQLRRVLVAGVGVTAKWIAVASRTGDMTIVAGPGIRDYIDKRGGGAMKGRARRGCRESRTPLRTDGVVPQCVSPLLPSW
jgi:DegV family protein with EDD domain